MDKWISVFDEKPEFPLVKKIWLTCLKTHQIIAS